ncbi:MAG TPA: DNA repair protein RecO [Cyclobacteriaceae bacterium]|nr:DNA repair protein RecO [Cyclobacteriaceae bacterium]
MIHKTRGIVFRFTRFRETSIIVTIFTELFGLQSYIVNGVRSSKAGGNKMALYQPLTLLDLVVYHRESANIHRIKEIKCCYHYGTLTKDVKKTTLAIFINEIVTKTVKEESHAQELFEFLFHSFVLLDQQEEGVENFHLIFLTKLSRLLGFGAHKVEEISGSRILNPQEEAALETLLKSEYGDPIILTQSQRRAILNHLLLFYAEHVETLGEIKSTSVLRELLS